MSAVGFSQLGTAAKGKQMVVMGRQPFSHDHTPLCNETEKPNAALGWIAVNQEASNTRLVGCDAKLHVMCEAGHSRRQF